MGSEMCIRDRSYISSTIIDGNESGTVVVLEDIDLYNDSDGDGTTEFHNWCTPLLTGFTITNGLNSEAGGIRCDNSSLTIANVVISGNTVTGSHVRGGGVYLLNANPIITNVTIKDNIGGYYGGGIYSQTSNPIITNTTIANNRAAVGGGIHLSGGSPTFTNVVTVSYTHLTLPTILLV